MIGAELTGVNKHVKFFSEPGDGQSCELACRGIDIM